MKNRLRVQNEPYILIYTYGSFCALSVETERNRVQIEHIRFVLYCALVCALLGYVVLCQNTIYFVNRLGRN